MSTFIRRNLSGITASSIEKYLLLTGWDRDYSFVNDHISVFQRRDDIDFRIAVPATEDFSDYYERVYDLVTMLSLLLDKSENEIINSLKSAYTDRIEFRIITETSKEGKIPLDYAAQCLAGLKDLVLYAACAEEKASPICARTYNAAKSSLDKFQFEQTGMGSFVFNVGVRVASEEFEQLFLEEIDPPPPESTEHKVIKRIATAIQQVNAVADRQIKISDLVVNAYENGLTANMCDALSMLRPTGGEDIVLETSVHYAEAITREVVPASVSVFDNMHFALVDEISRVYKDCTLIEDVSFTGMITMLSKNGLGTGDDAENKIRLWTKYEGRMRAVDLLLSPDDHAMACDAYRDEKEVRVAGTLDKSGKHWFFSEVIEFSVLD